MSTFKYHKPGLQNVGSYQASAIPYVTSSLTVAASGTTGPTSVSFPQISRFVTIKNTVDEASTTGSMRVGFSSQGTVASSSLGHPNNYFILDPGESYTGEWRVRDIYLMGHAEHEASASIIAGLTPISTSSLAFDNWSGSLGIG